MASHDNNADVCGIVLYSLFFILVCARVRPFFVDGGRSLSSTDAIKLAFHLCLLGSSLLEIGKGYTCFPLWRNLYFQFAIVWVAAMTRFLRTGRRVFFQEHGKCSEQRTKRCSINTCTSYYRYCWYTTFACCP